MVTKRRVKIPIFNYLMIVYVFDEWKDLKNNIPDDIYNIPNSNGVTIDYEDSCIICCSSNAKFKSTIVHESGHIKNLIWKYIGYTPMRDNDEVDQYLQSYIFEQIERIIEKHLTK